MLSEKEKVKFFKQNYEEKYIYFILQIIIAPNNIMKMRS